MSLWTIERAGDQLRLTYTHEPLAANPLVQPCGATDASSSAELEAWVFDQADVWDIIDTPHGRFVRQRRHVDEVRSVSSRTVAAATA